LFIAIQLGLIIFELTYALPSMNLELIDVVKGQTTTSAFHKVV